MAERIPAAVTVQRILKPEDWRDKQIGTLGKVGRSNYLLGIGYPKHDPIKEAIRHEGKWIAETRAACDEERHAKALGVRTIEEWFSYSKEIGADALVPGVTKRVGKVDRFLTAYHPKLNSLLAEVDKKPVDTLEERIGKSGDTIRGLAALRGVVYRRS